MVFCLSDTNPPPYFWPQLTVTLSDTSAFVHQLNSLLQTLVLSVSLSVCLPGPCSLSLFHSSISSLFTPQAKSEVAILINLPASLQLTSGQPHLKLHSLLLNQAGETERVKLGNRESKKGTDKYLAGEVRLT